MKVVFDHNVPKQLCRFLGSYLVLTADELGWNLLANGLLMRKAQEDGFTVLVTCDSDFKAHEGDRARTIAIVYLNTNHRASILAAHEAIRKTVESAGAGSFAILDIPQLPKRRKPVRKDHD